MKNILNVKPSQRLNARLKFSVGLVNDKDVVDKKVLDIGCGYGWFELNVLKRGVKEITGMEISDLDLETARKNIHDKRAKFVVAGAIKLPFPDNYFDTVVSWEVIEHIPKGTEPKMFHEVYRVLKKKGAFYLSTPYSSIPSVVLDPAFWLVGHRHYSKDKLTRLGTHEKFIIKEIQVLGKWWNISNILNMYISKWIFRRKPFLQDFFSKKEQMEYQQKNGFQGIFVKYEK